MPYHLSEDKLCVIKDGDTEPVKCHATEQEAKDHLAALHANVEDATKGGPGSGNFGHGGRPGERGGSTSGGGSERVVSGIKEKLSAHIDNLKEQYSRATQEQKDKLAHMASLTFTEYARENEGKPYTDSFGREQTTGRYESDYRNLYGAWSSSVENSVAIGLSVPGRVLGDYARRIEDRDYSLKSGARNNAEDKSRIVAIREAATQIVDHTMQMDPPAQEKHEVIMGSKPVKSDMPEALMIALPDIPGAVKALGDWELEVLGVPFGGPKNGRDSDGQYFSANTNTYGEYFKTIPVYYYHSMNPDGRSMQSNPALIGTAKYQRTDAKGHWFKVVLNKADEYAKRIWDAAKRGIARASSGSLSHIVRVDKSGEILHWPVAELSLIDAEGKRQPANAWAVATPIMQASYMKANLQFPVIPSVEDDDTTVNDPDGDAGEALLSGPGTVESIKKQGEIEMDEKDVDTKVQAAVADALKVQRKADEEAAKAETEKQAAIKTAVDEKMEALRAEYVKGNRLPFLDTVTVAKHSDLWKYDHLDAGDQAVLIGALKSARKDVSPHAYSALKLKLEGDKTEVGEQGQRAMKAVGMKAGEIDYSTSTGYGDEWVGVAYSQALWEAIRVGTFVVSKIPSVEVPQGMESIYLPLESTDPVWYNVAENTVNGTTTGSPAPTITSSRIATSRALLTLAKLGARVVWSGEMEESSLIPFAGQVKQQLAVSGAEYLESAIIDGDTETTDSTNINNIGGAEVTGGHYLAFDGFRKSCLVTTTANSRAGGALDVDDFIETVKLMGGAGINALDTSKVSFIMDPNVNWKFISLPELLTRDVAGNPTLEGGKLSQIWGYGVNVSGAMHFMSAVRKANSVGKVDTTTTANNIYGAILAVRWDQWKLGWRRRITMETTRFANSDSNEIVAMLRVGLKQRDTEASAITYGVAV